MPILTCSKLKELFPLYPVVRRVKTEKGIVFSTLVRKRYEGKYYLIPFKVEENTEAKAIHQLHSTVYKYFMIGKLLPTDVLDENQINEVERLTKI